MSSLFKYLLPPQEEKEPSMYERARAYFKEKKEMVDEYAYTEGQKSYSTGAEKKKIGLKHIWLELHELVGFLREISKTFQEFTKGAMDSKGSYLTMSADGASWGSGASIVKIAGIVEDYRTHHFVNRDECVEVIVLDERGRRASGEKWTLKSALEGKEAKYAQKYGCLVEVGAFSVAGNLED